MYQFGAIFVVCKLEYAQTEIFIMNNFKDYISEDELTLVGFHVSWCEECKKTMRETIPEFKKLTDNNVRVLKIDIGSPANAAKAHEYNIKSVPTLMFFHRGNILWKSSGIILATELKELYDTLLAIL